jgi:hypothetical protein
MIEDMTVCNFVEKTRNDYIRQVRTFTAFLGRSPGMAVPEDHRRFQLHQTQTGVRAPSMNGSVAALALLLHRDVRLTQDRRVIRSPRRGPQTLVDLSARGHPASVYE